MTSSGVLAEIDFIEELRLRRWARENYVPAAQRQPTWHPVVLEEMSRKERDAFTLEADPMLTASEA
jgi:hypothetical protein